MEALPAKQTRFSQCEPTVIDDRLDRWIRYTEKQREVLYSIHLTVINNKGGTRLVSSVMLTDHRKACFLWSFCVFNVQPLTCMVKMGLYLFNLCRCGNFFCLFVCFVVFLEFPFFVDFFFFFGKKKDFTAWEPLSVKACNFRLCGFAWWFPLSIMCALYNQRRKTLSLTVTCSYPSNARLRSRSGSRPAPTRPTGDCCVGMINSFRL